MTVQEIQEIGFEKAVFGGYDMKSVDTFLERVAEEFAAMQKENASLKAKMTRSRSTAVLRTECAAP